jgi:hypothetical protein
LGRSDLLESTDLPSAAIAGRIGAHDPYYFNPLVRRFFGDGPTRSGARDTLLARPDAGGGM